MAELQRGWNWVSVDWLYGWMIKTQPINNRRSPRGGRGLKHPAREATLLSDGEVVNEEDFALLQPVMEV